MQREKMYKCPSIIIPGMQIWVRGGKGKASVKNAQVLQCFNTRDVVWVRGGKGKASRRNAQVLRCSNTRDAIWVRGGKYRFQRENGQHHNSVSYPVDTPSTSPIFTLCPINHLIFTYEDGWLGFFTPPYLLHMAMVRTKGNTGENSRKVFRDAPEKIHTIWYMKLEY